MLLPQTKVAYLEPGDTIDIIAPSSKCHPSVLDKFRDIIHSWGLHCHIPNDLFGDNLLYANSDEKRFTHLQNALLNPNSKAVWCLLGGYGSTKLMPRLNQIKLPPHSKLLMGFSDITALHIFLQNQWGWPTLGAPSGYQVSLNRVAKTSVELLQTILFRKEESLIYDNITPLNQLANKQHTITAPIIGGNLHLIQASLGTFWQINATEKILFIEEFNERAYRIDRILAQLEQAGIFKGAMAILFGDMIDKGEPDGRFLVKDVIQEFATQCALPVLQISNIGHGAINNPLLLGHPATLVMKESCYLEFLL
ncbi:LD-carboxypeptidase [Legionella busanensis]|uniref:LD-carboxypeptidase n=1 Tax=Legionella busanensis TaxID=190655 RepID=A0A378JQ68_9GAMM|nr:LD-carboxypeptidase [Legionella busanensis]STX52319.1 LD-carboxypeptidase [Legionella busanensis]